MGVRWCTCTCIVFSLHVTDMLRGLLGVEHICRQADIMRINSWSSWAENSKSVQVAQWTATRSSLGTVPFWTTSRGLAAIGWPTAASFASLLTRCRSGISPARTVRPRPASALATIIATCRIVYSKQYTMPCNSTKLTCHVCPRRLRTRRRVPDFHARTLAPKVCKSLASMSQSSGNNVVHVYLHCFRPLLWDAILGMSYARYPLASCNFSSREMLHAIGSVCLCRLAG